MKVKHITTDEGTVIHREFCYCEQNLDMCKANRKGKCIALDDTHFNRPCPFFKHKNSKG